jgi:AcrR family transcriptional regulator
MVRTLPVIVSDCDVKDPRIRRTRQLLQGALRKLMQSKGFDEVSVQDIADAATVNRATFYDHYTDKFALLEAMVAGGFHQLLRERSVSYDGTCASAARPIILATCDYLALNHRDCPRQPERGAFEPLIDAAVAGAIRRVLLAGLPKPDAAGGPPAEMIATAASGALLGAVKEWLRTPPRPPAEEAAGIILPLVLPILLAAKPGSAEVAAAGAAHA